MSNVSEAVNQTVSRLSTQIDVLKNTLHSERLEMLAITKKAQKQRERADYVVIMTGIVCFVCGMLGGFYIQVGGL